MSGPGAARHLLAVWFAAMGGLGLAAAFAQAPPAATTATSRPAEAVRVPPVALRVEQSLLESAPTGWIDIQPRPDLAGWTRSPWPATATLGPQQWSVDPATGLLVCDGKGGHEVLSYAKELANAAFHVEWRFTPVPGADKYNSGVMARSALDLSVWHQAQAGPGRGGFLFGATKIDGEVRRFRQEAAAERVRPAGEWNTYEIVARGRTLSLWVNGAVTAELPACDVPKGHFGLEAEGWRIEFRNLKLKPLD